MLTSPASPVVDGAPAKDDRPGYRPYVVRVARVRQLSPHFTRVTFTGPDLASFGTDRLDQRVKILFPGDDGRLCDVGATDPEVLRTGAWYERWRQLPEDERGPFRTYTVRDVRPRDLEVDIDMVHHGEVGVAGRWLTRAAVGDEVVLVGPDALSTQSSVGIDWAPDTATELLLAGDETAVPAICSILETLEPGRTARAFLEVPDAADMLDVRLPEGATITWLPRSGRAHGDLLVPAVREWVSANARVVDDALADSAQSLEDVDVDSELLWDSPAVQVLPVDMCGRGGERCGSDFYAWFAGEAGVIRTLRRVLVSDTGVCRRRVAFMGYWRLGRAESQ